MSSQAFVERGNAPPGDWKTPGSAGAHPGSSWSGGLKLYAGDEEDYLVISAHLQDAIVAVAEMTYSAADGRFAMLVNRFMWEAASTDLLPDEETPAPAALRDDDPESPEDEEVEADEPGAIYRRTNCGVLFEGVEAVKCRGIDRSRPGTFMDLLAVELEPDAVHLRFGGGACLRLEGSEISCRMQDLGEPWPTTVCPCHAHAFED